MLDRSVMDMSFIDKLAEDRNYVWEVSPKLWLMDDHRWAFYVWEKIRGAKHARYALAHLDFHYDGVNDFEDAAERGALISIDTLDAIFDMVKAGERVRYDSFIAPAIIRGFISEVHFFCRQSEEDTEPGVDEDILSQYDCRQSFYLDPKELVAKAMDAPLLFDLCLDLFNKDDDKMYEGTLWSDAEILGVMEICRPLLERAAVVTVSMSFGYSGTEDQTRYLAKLVVPKCLSLMKAV